MIPPSRALHLADYGPRARVGIATPQANPTVEPELRELLPPCIGMYTTRLSHRAAQVEHRLNHYVRHIPEAIESFGTMKIRAFGFGCTASSYLAGRVLETELTEAASSRHRIPVITAAQAIRRALEALGMTRIALVSPYPVALAEAGYRYWEECGLHVVARLHVDPYLTDTHRIYELSNDDALSALRRIERHDAQCVLASGTGMPTLNALRRFREETAMPVLSSNLCLAWSLVQTVAPELAPTSPAGMLDAAPVALAAAPVLATTAG